MYKAILFLSGALLFLETAPAAFAKDPCVALCDGSGITQQQLQGQQQRLTNQNTLSNGQSQNAVASVTGGNVSSTNTNSLTATGGSSYSGGNTNSQSTVFQTTGIAPAMTAVPPGLAGNIGFGVCATQDSHSDGVGVGVGVIGPSAGINFSHGNTNTSENLQCDYGRTVQAVCQLNPNFRVKGHHTAGEVCAHVMAKLAGVSEAIAELDQEDQQMAKQETVVRSTTGWGHCDHNGACFNGAGQRTN